MSFHMQNKYETREPIEVMGEDCVRVLAVSLFLLACWFIISIFMFCFSPDRTPVLYWVFRVLKIISKWGGILLFILFIVFEIYVKILKKKGYGDEDETETTDDAEGEA